MGFELAEQLDWRLPDVIIYPTGGGTGLIGMWKALKSLSIWGGFHQKGHEWFQYKQKDVHQSLKRI